MRSFITLVFVLSFASAAIAQTRQPTPLPALGQDSVVDRQIVTTLQEQLLALGYQVTVTGHIGRDTREAIIDFSTSRGISVDGPDTDRIVAIDTAYAAMQRHVTIAPIPAPPQPEYVIIPGPRPPIRYVPLVAGAGSIGLIGVGFAGLAMRESIVTGYNARCRGFGDPRPAMGCDETTNASSARDATAIATAGFVAGGIAALVAVVLFTLPVRTNTIAWSCGGGPGDIGITCGGAL